jgi:hypothetical protein
VPSRKRRRTDDSGAVVALDKRVTESATGKAYAYGCPICNHQVDRLKYIKDHIMDEIKGFNSSFYTIAGCSSLEPPNVASWACGFCTDHEPFSGLSELVDHVADDHCRRLAHDKTNPKSFEPFLGSWSISTVMHNHLNHGILKEEYSNTIRTLTKNGHKPRLIWPIVCQTLCVLRRLQTRDYNEDNAGDLANKASKAKTLISFTFRHSTKSVQSRPDQVNRPDARPSGAAGSRQSCRGNTSPPNEAPSTTVGTHRGGDSVSQTTQPSNQPQGVRHEPASVARGTPGENFSARSCPSEPISRGQPNRSMSDCAINTPNAHPPDNVDESAISGRGSAGEDPLTELEIGLGHMGVWAEKNLLRAPEKFPVSGGSHADLLPFTISDSLDGLLPFERYIKNKHDLRMFVIRSRTDSSKASIPVSDGFESSERAQIRSEWSDRAGIGHELSECVEIGTDDSEPEFEFRRCNSPTRIGDTRPSRFGNERQSRLRRRSNHVTPLGPVSFT